MKSKFLFALLGIAAMFAGCSQENVESFTANKTTSFKVSVDEGVQTRAGGNAPTRYIMEMYEGATTDGTPNRVEQTANTFDVILKDAQAYTVLFWADYGTANDASGANEYDAASLKAAKVAAGKQATKAAFAGKVSFTTGTDDADVYTAVTLNHAVAQVNFKQTEVLTAATNTLTVGYPESYSINVFDGSVTKIDGAVTHTFTYNDTAIGTLGTSYIIAATGETKTIMEIEATLNSEAKKTIPNVSFGCNYRTNISGAYSNLYSAALTASCDDAWEATDNEATLPIQIEWAKGNLVANADNNGCVIGDPTDNGLYFQFGSLVGWSETGAIAVKPYGCTVTSLDTSWTGDPVTDNAVTGTGDPCRYYLGGTWRLPTNDEYVKLFGNNGYPSSAWSWNATSKSATNSTLGLTFPASGRLSFDGLGSVGASGFYWSASFRTAGYGYNLGFDSSSVNPIDNFSRMTGLSVRCVQEK